MSNEAMEAAGVAIKIGDAASPEVFNTIAEITDFNGPGGQASVIDVSHLQSTFVEKLMGLPDDGQLSFNANMRADDTTGQNALRTARANRTKKNFQIVLTDSPATTISFSGFVLEYTPQGAVNDKIAVSITIEVDGQASYS